MRSFHHDIDIHSIISLHCNLPYKLSYLYSVSSSGRQEMFKRFLSSFLILHQSKLEGPSLSLEESKAHCLSAFSGPVHHAHQARGKNETMCTMRRLDRGHNNRVMEEEQWDEGKEGEGKEG